MRDDFAVFILTHGRPDNIQTLKTLIKGNYTGKYYLLVDDEDSTLDEYIAKYGDKVCVFHKENNFDLGDNLTEYKAVPVYARNEAFRIARELGLKYFLELDDDYKRFGIKYEGDKKLKTIDVKDFDTLFEATVSFLEETKITCLAYAVEGDYIGGLEGRFKQGMYQNARNTFFCSVDREFEFLGRINEDVTTPAYHNMLGRLFFTILDVFITMTPHEKNKGGSSEQYKETNLIGIISILFCGCQVR